MRRAVLCFALLMVCTLSACSSSEQNAANSIDTNQSVPASTEVSMPETTAPPEDTAAEMPARILFRCRRTEHCCLNMNIPIKMA